MPGVRRLQRIQIGAESAKGTSVAATTKWRGMGTLEDARVVENAEENVGILPGLDDTQYIPMLGGKLAMEAVPATFEQLPYILEASIAAATPAQDGSGSDYIYTYTVPTTTQGSFRTYTIEGGDDQQEEEMEYCFVPDFTLKGEDGKAWTMEANWEGRQIVPSTFTGSLAVPAVDYILFQKTKLYINAVGTFPATSQITGSFRKFELKVKSGLKSYGTGEGNLYFTAAKRSEDMELELKITFEHDSNATTELAAWRAGTSRAFRIDATGAAVTSAGSVYSTRRAIIDLLGKYEKFDKIGEINGNDIREATIKARYNGTAASAGRIIVVNDLSALA